jgi:hypothetical protein
MTRDQVAAKCKEVYYGHIAGLMLSNPEALVIVVAQGLDFFEIVSKATNVQTDFNTNFFKERFSRGDLMMVSLSMKPRKGSFINRLDATAIDMNTKVRYIMDRTMTCFIQKMENRTY